MRKHPSAATSAAKQIGSAPFLKWLGGKRRLATRILSLLPSEGRLIEPFVGAGSVFLASEHAGLILNDSNADLMTIYTALQVAICNHDTLQARCLYAGSEITEIQVARSISASATLRKPASEIIAVYRPNSQG